ncbi:MAG TPA: ATP-binding protein [Povalibacter sp.]|uniref:sensor histidine kinase n=1 Tax=Povalibacter sp. TaxID=1962978 RepID=UPI002CF2A63C|nr:ATP-binding protein [Povalibacter sp.]HMN46697.1 ATP-binding protein [Povalibacter sp.]
MLTLRSPVVSLHEGTLRRRRRFAKPSPTTPAAAADAGVQAAASAAELRMTAAAGLEAMRRDLLLRTLGWILLVFTLLLPIAIAHDLQTRPWTLWMHGFTYSVLLLAWCRRSSLNSRAIALVVLGSLYVLGTVGLLRTGITSINGLAYGLIAITTPLIFGIRRGIAMTALCGITYAIVGALSLSGVLTFEVMAGDYATSAANWVHAGAAFMAFAVTAVVISGTTSRKLRALLHSEAARSQMLTAANERLAEANARLHDLNVELEKRIAERTHSLEEANRELESFSYTVSHDLRSPLQVIEGFSSLALQEGGAGTTGKVCDYLHRIQNGARRMHEMIGHLLQFSQIGSRVVDRAPVNLSDVAHRILFDLQVTEPGRQVESDVEHDMFESADPDLIGNVLHNLLGNAWKFSARQQPARIGFSRSQSEGRFVYQVRDNGVGFDTATAQRLFQPFVRLHDKREFQGSGVGLATAKRIIDRHGGRIWVESRPGEGTTFFFTLAA